jgi:hypothetical protein
MSPLSAPYLVTLYFINCHPFFYIIASDSHFDISTSPNIQTVNIKTTKNKNFQTRQYVLLGAFIKQIATTDLKTARPANRTSLLIEKRDHHYLYFHEISCVRLFFKSVDTFRF